MTSFQAVARIRRLFSIKKVGHCGTLDPFAEGVLPICIARSTAAVQYMDVYDKSYIVTFRLGRSTDTQDLEGETVVLRTPSSNEIQALLADDASVIRESVQAIIGVQLQTPPIYSALKLDGRPLYSYARAGETVDLSKKTREITVYDARFLEAYVDTAGDAEAPLVVKAWIKVSKGTYIRTLVHDLGERLGFGAYCIALVRDMTGPFLLEDSVTFEEIELKMTEEGNEHPLLRTVDEALSYLPMVKLNEHQAKRFAHGQFIELNHLGTIDGQALDAEMALAANSRYRVGGPNGLVGVATVRLMDDGDIRLAAERVFIKPNE